MSRGDRQPQRHLSADENTFRRRGRRFVGASGLCWVPAFRVMLASFGECECFLKQGICSRQDMDTICALLGGDAMD